MSERNRNVLREALSSGFAGRQKAAASKNKILNLYTPPKKESRQETPRLQAFAANAHHQADLLQLPKDKKKEYALVVADVGTRKTDAVPLSGKSAPKVLEGFKTIYEEHNILEIPSRIDVDDGGEFKSVVKKYFQEKGTFFNQSTKAARHRHIALAENRNKYIGKLLFMLQNEKEDKTGRVNREWVKQLPDVIAVINEKIARDPYNKKIPKKPKGSVFANDLIPIGTKVRVQLDRPEDLRGEPLTGIQRFRATDIRWSPIIRTVIHINLTPGYPPTYEVDNPRDHIKYTKNQLQIVPDNETN